MDNENQGFDQWCIVELMGRQVIAGRVTEQVIGGSAMIRVDVPETNGQAAFSRFYGNAAIYAITPVSEEVARLAVKRYTPEPITIYIPELRLPAPAAIPLRGDPTDEDFDDEDFDYSDEFEQ